MQNVMRRVVVTGLGMVTPLASGVKPTWDRLLAGESGIGPITRFDVSDITCRIAGEVPEGDGDDSFKPDEWVEPKDQRKIDRFILFAIAAARQAIEDAGWMPDDEESRDTGAGAVGNAKAVHVTTGAGPGGAAVAGRIKATHFKTGGGAGGASLSGGGPAKRR